MKTVFFAILFALSFAREGCAGGPITFDITTTDAGVSYTLTYGPRIEGNPKTPDEIEAWLTGVIKKIGDRELILVYVDDRTSFKTVLELLRRFRAAGVKMYSVMIPDGSTAYSLSGETAKIGERSYVKPPQK